MKKQPFKILCSALLAAVCLAGCSGESPIASGPGDETIIGYVYDTDRNPAPGTIVKVFKKARMPFDAVAPDLIDTADADGRYEFRGMQHRDTVDLLGTGVDTRKRFLVENVTPSAIPRYDTLTIPDSVRIRVWGHSSADSVYTGFVPADSMTISFNGGEPVPIDSSVLSIIDGFSDGLFIMTSEYYSPDTTIRFTGPTSRRFLREGIANLISPPDASSLDSVYEVFRWNPLPDVSCLGLAVWEGLDRILIPIEDSPVRLYTLAGMPVPQPARPFPSGFSYGSLDFFGDTLCVLETEGLNFYAADGRLLRSISIVTMTADLARTLVPKTVRVGENGDLFVSMEHIVKDAGGEWAHYGMLTRRLKNDGTFLNDLPEFPLAVGNGYSLFAADTKRNRCYQTIPADGRVVVTSCTGTILDTLSGSSGTSALDVGPSGDLFVAGNSRLFIFDTLGNRTADFTTSFHPNKVIVAGSGLVYMKEDYVNESRFYCLRPRGSTAVVPGTIR